MGSLLAEVIPLALGAAISPVLFLLQLTTLTGQRPIARGSALSVGAAAVLIIVSTAGVLIGDNGFSTNDTLQAWINVGFGALLILIGLRGLLRPRTTHEPSTPPERGSLGRAFLMGAGGMASNLTTFALYVPALALIAGSGLPLRQQGIASMVILVITLMVVWVPLALVAFVPGASSNLLPRLGSWMERNDRWIQVVLGLGFGVWLLLKGVNAL